MATPTRDSDGPAVDDDSLARRLRDARRAIGLTQQEAADKLNVSRRAVSEWETGVRQPHVALPALAALYGVSTSFLLYGVEPSSVELREVRADVRALRDEIGLLTQRLADLAETTADAFDEIRKLLADDRAR